MASPLSVRLDEKTKRRITRIARRKRVSTSEAVRQAIAAWAERQESAGSLYDRMADLIGVVNGGDPTRSSDIGKKFTKYLRNRRRNA
jgi:Arc/MetJ-type ribon-helix-helix transcriptional regulator